MGRIGLRQRLRPDKMARRDRGVASRAKPGLPRDSFATAGGFGAAWRAIAGKSEGGFRLA